MHDDINDARGHELWAAFERFVHERGIQTGPMDDWQQWWDCFIAGAGAQFFLCEIGYDNNIPV